MTITAQVIADSISPEGIRLTTMQLRYPRFIHAEAKTHRVITIDGIMYEETIDTGFMDDPDLSRNASSSRAIPVNRMIEDLRRDPAMPIFWGSNKPGMQAGEELNLAEIDFCKSSWNYAMLDAIRHVEGMVASGLHKQIANRILEPWAHINVVVTATDWENFFTLRRHADAQPEIKALADAMHHAMSQSTPTNLLPGEWHLPYITKDDRKEANFGPSQTYGRESLKAVSVARCARVSYLTHDGRQTTIDEDLALYDRLLGAQPLHASPAEHQATPDILNTGKELTQFPPEPGWEHPEQHGNFRGWIQLRKTLPGEFIAG